MATKTGHSPTDKRATVNEELLKRPLPPKAKAIRVRAIRTGYYEHIRRREGDVFDLVPRQGVQWVTERPAGQRPRKVKKILEITPDEQFSPEWMEEVTPRTPLRESSSQDEIRRQHDEILATRRPGHVPAPGDEPEPREGELEGDQGGTAATGDQDPLGSGQ